MKKRIPWYKGQKRKRPPLSEEHKRKIVATRRKNGSYGWSEESRKKISEALKGKKRGPLTEEHKRKIVATRRKNGSYKLSEEQKKGRGLNSRKFWKTEKSKEVRKKLSEINRGENHPQWKGGRFEQKGYFYLSDKRECPYAVKSIIGKVLEHHYIWWKNYPDDPILKGEVIHHKNGNRQDNRIENLEKMTNGEHMRLHMKDTNRSTEQLFKKGHSPWNKGKTGVFSKTTLQKMRGQVPWNKGKTGVYSKTTLQKMSEIKKRKN